jgi:GT2 family glycosyltransferase
MDLSISILTRNQPELLPQCVASCIAEIERAGVSSEIIIVDNASTDAYPQRLARMSPMIRIIRNEENLGFSAANNKAIRVSHGRYVLILNDDTVLQRDSLRLMVGKLDSDPRVGAVGPKLLNPDGSLQRDFTNRRFPHPLHCLAMVFLQERRLGGNAWTSGIFGLNRDLERTSQAEHVAGACLLVRREALDAVGLFDEGFNYWFEDVDLCFRLKKAEWKVIYAAEAQVTHYQSASIGKIAEPERAVVFFRSQMYYLRKHWSAPKYLFVRFASAFALLVDIPLLVLKRCRRRLSREQWNAWMETYLPVVRALLVEWEFRIEGVVAQPPADSDRTEARLESAYGSRAAPEALSGKAKPR